MRDATSKFPDMTAAKAKARTNGGDNNAQEYHTWPDPVDFLSDRDLGAPQLKEQHVPPSLWPYISDTAERLGVATSSVALATIVSCSSAISEEWQLQPKRYDFTWKEGARLWGAIVGPPSILKSPIIAIATAPVVAMEARARKEWAEQMTTYRAALAAWKADKIGDEPTGPQRQRFLVESATLEALQEVLRAPDDGEGKMVAPLGKVLVRQDELAEFLASMDKYSSAKGSDRGGYLRLYNGGPFSIDRIGRGAFTTNSWSGCLLGGIQPEPLQRVAGQTVDDGLLQRMMLDVPPPQGTGKDQTPDHNALQTYRDLFPVLAALRPTTLGTEYPQVAVLHANAHAAREDVDTLARALSAMPDTSARLQSTFGKWSGLFARLSLTYHLIEIAAAKTRGEIGPPPGVVTPDTATRVQNYMRQILAPNLLRAENIIFSSKGSDHASWIAHYILAHRLERVTARNIVQDYRQLRAPEQRDTLNITMDALCTLDWLAPLSPRFEARPPVTWIVNPKAHTLFAERGNVERARRAAVRNTIARHVASLRDDVGNVA